ncbi:MAG TPA: hypothetical protein VLF79_04095 [Candidatus Saccharimonadales bacterium]|nr:hypothetical protein [Candidatus Saccharimonadales bacterium]
MAILEFGRVGYQESQRELNFCLNCNSDLNVPVKIDNVSNNNFHVQLRCLDCGADEVGEFTADEVFHLADTLEKSTDTIFSNMGRLASGEHLFIDKP